MHIAWVPMLTQLVATPLHLLWCWLFVIRLEMGIKGLGIALIVTNFGLLAMVEGYSLCVSRIRESLFCPDKHTFTGWKEYFKLGVPATLMLCAELWAY